MNLIAMSRIRLRISGELVRRYSRIKRFERSQLAVGAAPTVRCAELPTAITAEDRVGLPCQHENRLIVGGGIIDVRRQNLPKRDRLLSLEILVIFGQVKVNEGTAVEGGFTTFFAA